MSDTTRPTVVKVEPADGALAVEPTVSVTVTFDEKVAAASVADAFLLSRGTTPVPVSVTVAPDGLSATLAPQVRLDMLATYTAEVSGTVTDMAGNALQSGRSWTFTVRDGRWDTPFTVPGAGSGPFGLGVADPGTAYVAWIDGSSGEPRVTRSTIGSSTWESPRNLAAGAPEAVHACDINVASRGGSAAVVWTSRGSSATTCSSNRVWASVFSTSWSPAQPLDTGAGSLLPRVDLDEAGHGLAVWVQHTSTTDNLWAAALDGTWQPPAAVTAFTSARLLDLVLRVARDGTAIAMWTRSSTAYTNRYVEAARYVPGTGWGATMVLSGPTSLPVNSPDLAFDDAGDATLVWCEQEGDGDHALATRYVAGASLGAKKDFGLGTYPRVAMDAQGNAVATWLTNGMWDVSASRYEAHSATGWGASVLLETSSSRAGSPQVVLAPDGRGLVLWAQWESSSATDVDSVWSARFSPADGWAAPVLGELNVLDVNSVSVGSTSAGAALAVWSQPDGLWANWFD